jgi:hypothetical protein
MTSAEAGIREFLEKPPPADAKEDLRDLGVIGYANTLPGVTPEMLAMLIAEARRNGRSWDQIGRRLGMTVAEAESAYRELADASTRSHASRWRHRIAESIRAFQDLMDSALERAAAEVERQHIDRR